MELYIFSVGSLRQYFYVISIFYDVRYGKDLVCSIVNCGCM